jgi:hypothetical protein
MTAFDVETLAKALKKSPRTVKRWCAQGVIPGAKKGKSVKWEVEGKSFSDVVEAAQKATYGFARSRGGNPRKKRLSVNANDKSVGILTIEGVAGNFNLWLRKVEAIEFSPDQLERLEKLLRPMADVHRLVVEDLARARKSPSRA